jgi:uncharacterized C2H2 Zn-finger protein
MNKLYTIALIIGLIFMSACSTSGKRIYRGKQYTHKVNKSNKTYSTYQNPKSKKIDKKIYTHPTMRPYVIRGIKYYPTVVSVGDSFKGNSSWTEASRLHLCPISPCLELTATGTVCLKHAIELGMNRKKSVIDAQCNICCRNMLF